LTTTSTSEPDPDTVKMNPRAKYLRKRSLSSKVTGETDNKMPSTHKPIKWSVIKIGAFYTVELITDQWYYDYFYFRFLFNQPAIICTICDL